MKILLIILVSVITFKHSLASTNECLKVYADKENINIKDLEKENLNSKLVNNYQLDFVNLFSVIEENYAPLIFKAKYENFDWNNIKKETLAASRNAKSEAEIFKLYSELLFKFNDAHVSIQGPTSLTWKLPVQMDYISGKYLINYLSKEYPSDQKTPALGDEVIAINGLPIEKFRTQFNFFNSHANTLTNKRLFAVTFPQWKEAMGLPLSFLDWSEISLDIKTSDNLQYTIHLPIKKEGVGFKELFSGVKEVTAQPLQLAANTQPISKHKISLLEREFEKKNPHGYALLNKVTKITNMLSLAYLHENEKVAKKNENPSRKEVGKKIEIGGTESSFPLPKDFKKIEVGSFLLKIPLLDEFIGSNFFQAGVFIKDQKKVGYLRVPSYAPSFLFTILPFLRFTIHELEKNSDYLIIDQINNPGGYVVLSDWLIEALTGKYNYDKHLKFATKPSISFLRSYTEIIDGINKMENINPEIKKSLAQRAEFELNKIKSAYSSKKYLTEPLDMTVLSDVAKLITDQFISNQENKAGASVTKWIINKIFGMDVTKDYVYSKPVYFLTNELDFSGGDATPASLQDYGRVKVIGTRTAGAGGTVEEFQIRSFLETSIRLTTSLMVRANGQLVENYGVTPDFIVERTESDLTNQNQAYFKKILDVISRDLKSH